MRRHRGNGHRRPKNRTHSRTPSGTTTAEQALFCTREQHHPFGPVCLSMHAYDPITGNDEALSALFYEHYRGYTIYSTEQGTCCIHGMYGGCFRLRGQFVCFPDIEQAKSMIKYFRAEGRAASESMNREIPEHKYIRLNRNKPPVRESSHFVGAEEKCITMAM